MMITTTHNYICSIMTAEAKRAQLKEKRKIEEERRKAEEQEKEQRIVATITFVLPLIRSKIEKSDDEHIELCFSMTDYKTSPALSQEEFAEAIERVVESLVLAGGYSAPCKNMYIYSDSWQAKSSKFGYIFISV